MSKFSAVTHVIFDLDGTIVDTESLISTAFENVIKNHEKVISFDVKQKLIGFPLKDRAEQVLNDIELDIDAKQFVDELINDCIITISKSGAKLMEGIESIVKYFKDNNIPMAIASGNTSQSYNMTRQRFGPFFDNFDFAVLSGDDKDVKRPKPHPDIYLVCAQRFSPEPKSMSNVLVFEDTDVGVRAASDANMQCIHILDKRVNPYSGSVDATLVINSFDQFQPQLFHLPKF